MNDVGKNKEIPESYIQEPEKTNEMALTEDTYRVLAKNAFKIGNEELAKEFLRKAGENAEVAGEVWEEERINQEVKRCAEEILDAREQFLLKEQ